MIRRTLSAFVWIVSALAFTAVPASAAPFDVIYADHIVVTTYPNNIGFSLSGESFGLLVNKGTTDIDSTAFFGMILVASSSNAAVQAVPGVGNPAASITPIHPDEAAGSVTSDNGVLTTLLQPGEALHNTAPQQMFTLGVTYPPGYTGQTTLHFTMILNDEMAQFPIVVDFTLGSQLGIAFPSAARTSSSPYATPAQVTTWGRLKKLYR